MNDDKGPRIVNPYSTANGGVTFEQLVGASYLVSLLADHMPRGLDRGITREVRFQRRTNPNQPSSLLAGIKSALLYRLLYNPLLCVLDRSLELLET
jgi:hypothetical protein